MFINVNACFLVSIETHMLAADLEDTTLKIGYAKQEFHDPMNSRKRGLGIIRRSWQLFHWISYSFHGIFVYNIAVIFQFFVNEMCRIINMQCIVWILSFLPEK